ncbi:DegV family protein [Aurantivibrio plasticivorans]
MSARACLAVDSACDLPTAFLQEHAIKILPINLKIGSGIYRDTRDPAHTIKLYKSKQLEEDFSAESEPASQQEISSFIESELASDYDEVLALTISSQRSGVYKNIRESAFVERRRLKEVRQKQGNTVPFKIRVVDSAALFTGQGVLAFEVIRLMKEGKLSHSEIVKHIERLKSKTRALLVPNSLYFLKNRARAKGDNSVSWLSYKLGNMMDIKPIVQGYKGITEPIAKVRGYDEGIKFLFKRAEDAIDKGLAIPVVVMSYAGDPRQIENLEIYQQFVARVKKKGITPLLSIMSTTGAINVGPGSFSLAYADD